MIPVILSYAPIKDALILKLMEFVPFDEAEPVEGEDYLESKLTRGSKAVIVAKYNYDGSLLALWTTFFRTEIMNDGIESYCCYAFQSIEEVKEFYIPLLDYCQPLNAMGGEYHFYDENGDIELTIPKCWVADSGQPYKDLSEADRAILERFGTVSIDEEGNETISLPPVTGVYNG